MPRVPTNQERELKAYWLHELEADRARLLLTQPFTAMIALNLEIVPVLDSRLDTAATDGRSIFFQIRFIEKLSESARTFVLAHEVWHVVCGHLQRRRDRLADLWNIAVDHEVNSLLMSDGLEIPKDGIYFAKQKGKSAESVYEWLQSQVEIPLSHGQVQFDQHDISSLLGEVGMLEGESIDDPDYRPQTVDAELAQVWRERIACVANSLKGQGKLPAHLEQFIKEKVDPQLPWHQLMRQFLQRIYGGSRSWLPPARRHIYKGLYLPSMRTQALNVAVAIDTSGSVGDDLLKFLSELEALLTEFDRVEVTLIECDAKISRVRVLTESNVFELRNTTLKGGGGTDLRPPFTHLRSSPPACLIYLTDGLGTAPEKAPAFPVLWVITKQGVAPSSWGQLAFICK
jgi:predicted metal-dependent peptidase